MKISFNQTVPEIFRNHSQTGDVGATAGHAFVIELIMFWNNAITGFMRLLFIFLFFAASPCLSEDLKTWEAGKKGQNNLILGLKSDPRIFVEVVYSKGVDAEIFNIKSFPDQKVRRQRQKMISLFGAQDWSPHSYDWKDLSENKGELGIRGSISIEKVGQNIFGLNVSSPTATQRVIISAFLPDVLDSLDLKELIKKGWFELQFNF